MRAQGLPPETSWVVKGSALPSHLLMNNAQCPNVFIPQKESESTSKYSPKQYVGVCVGGI